MPAPELADLATATTRDLAEPLGSAAIRLEAIKERFGTQIPDEPRRLLGEAIAELEDMQRRLSAAEETLGHHATHDALTGLPNRSALVGRLQNAVEQAREGGGVPAIVCLGLDEFQTIDEQLGHEAGEELLRQVAVRLTAAARPGDVVARFGGAEFTVLLTTVTTRREALEAAQALQAALQRPYGQRHEQGLTASIGIAVAEGSTGARAVLRAAEAAMRAAKGEGGSRIELYDRAMSERMTRRHQIERALREAITHDELTLAYQPIVRLADNSVTGLEALVRWEHDEWGPVSPGEFVPIAEESNLIVDLGQWVMTNALKQLAAWRAAGEPFAESMRLTVNLSTRHLARPEIVPFLRDALAATRIDPRSLDLEITETAFLSRRDIAVANVNALRSLGVGIALDDFGTGYSSLSHLQELPLDRVKLDGDFTKSLVPTPSATAIARALTSMAHALCLDVVAEGVESREQADLLLAMGCDHGQGYVFARPSRADEIGAVLAGMRGENA